MFYCWRSRFVSLTFSIAFAIHTGKTMTLTNVLQSVEGVILASLNFSSRTTPEIILKVFAQYCNYVRRGRDIVLEPAESLGSQAWLVVFCDEINLPEEDTYGTQRVIMFMRQLVEQGGFWRNDNVWVKINRIQFVGACNPPTDSGRFELSHRFLRHVPLLLVDFPETDSLMQIYGTFNGGMLKMFPNLKGETDALTTAMVEVYTENQKRFTPDIQPQYFYSPRELSRWVRGIYEAVVNMDQGLTGEELVRIWAHEGLRLFADRLVEDEDKKWCNEKLDEVAKKNFAHVDFDAALARPLFYTNWVSKDTRRIERNELKEFLTARLRVFYEEELDVPLVVFDEVLEHVLRIDRVLRCVHDVTLATHVFLLFCDANLSFSHFKQQATDGTRVAGWRLWCWQDCSEQVCQLDERIKHFPNQSALPLRHGRLL